MPLYAYECPNHGGWYEIRKIDERDTVFCQYCGHKAELIASPFSFRFSGEVSRQVHKQLSKGVKEDTKDWRWDSKQIEQLL